MHRDELLRELGQATQQHHRRWVYNARAAFRGIGVADAHGLVERRTHLNELRIGVADLVIEPL